MDKTTSVTLFLYKQTVRRINQYLKQEILFPKCELIEHDSDFRSRSVVLNWELQAEKFPKLRRRTQVLMHALEVANENLCMAFRRLNSARLRH